MLQLLLPACLTFRNFSFFTLRSTYLGYCRLSHCGRQRKTVHSLLFSSSIPPP